MNRIKERCEILVHKTQSSPNLQKKNFYIFFVNQGLFTIFIYIFRHIWECRISSNILCRNGVNVYFINCLKLK